MSYSAIDMYEAPSQSRSVVGALMGAAIGAVVGAVVLASVVTTGLYTPTVTGVKPAVITTTIPSATYYQQAKSAMGPTYVATQRDVPVEQQIVQTPQQGVSVYSWAFVLFAAVAGAVNGLFLWNNRRTAMAATAGRREALMAGVAAAGFAATPAFAAYGDAANVFGKSKEGVEQFAVINGDGWTITLPGKYNASKELEVPGQVGRWEDNFDAVNNAYVAVVSGSLGSIDDVRNNIVTPLLGAQVFEGQSLSEGGFGAGRYSNAAVLDQSQETKDGKTYYYYEFLTRTADGNEGGRHQLYAVTSSNGKVIIFKQQAGDKRWFKGLERPLRKSIADFRAK